MLPALPKVPRRLFSGLSMRPLLMDTLWGLLGQAAARGGVSGTLVGLWVSVRRRGIAAPSDRNLTLQTWIRSYQLSRKCLNITNTWKMKGVYFLNVPPHDSSKVVIRWLLAWWWDIVFGWTLIFQQRSTAGFTICFLAEVIWERIISERADSGALRISYGCRLQQIQRAYST